MDEHSVLCLLGQISCEISGEVIRGFLRSAVRKMQCEVMALGVSELCDEKHQPDGNSVFRAGSSVGRILVEGEREAVIKPRVRKRLSDGVTCEVTLKSYAAANDPKQLHKDVVDHET